MNLDLIYLANDVTRQYTMAFAWIPEHPTAEMSHSVFLTKFITHENSRAFIDVCLHTNSSSKAKTMLHPRSCRKMMHEEDVKTELQNPENWRPYFSQKIHTRLKGRNWQEFKKYWTLTFTVGKTAKYSRILRRKFIFEKVENLVWRTLTALAFGQLIEAILQGTKLDLQNGKAS